MFTLLNVIFKDMLNSFDWLPINMLRAKEFRTNSNLEVLMVARMRFCITLYNVRTSCYVMEALANTVVLNAWKEWVRSGD